MTQMYPF